MVIDGLHGQLTTCLCRNEVSPVSSETKVSPGSTVALQEAARPLPACHCSSPINSLLTLPGWLTYLRMNVEPRLRPRAASSSPQPDESRREGPKVCGFGEGERAGTSPSPAWRESSNTLCQPSTYHPHCPIRMPSDRTPKPNTKPLKPYRRGETLGKQGLKLRKPEKAKPNNQPPAASTNKGPRHKERREEPEEDGEGEEEAAERVEGEGSESEEKEVAPVPQKRVSGKKGKKFLDNVSAVLPGWSCGEYAGSADGLACDALLSLVMIRTRCCLSWPQSPVHGKQRTRPKSQSW